MVSWLGGVFETVGWVTSGLVCLRFCLSLGGFGGGGFGGGGAFWGVSLSFRSCVGLV